MFYLLGCVAALCLVGADDSTPIFHIDGNPNGAGDVNAIFFYGGYYHVMSQYVDASGTCTGWGHAVSSDMANWTRLENALACGPGKFDAGGVWDGSMTFLDAKTPIIFYDAVPTGQATARPRTRRALRSGDDPPVLGIAQPADPSDPLLRKWVKDPQNPVEFTQKSCGSGPSPIWRNGDTYEMIMIRDGKEARYTSNDSQSLHTWTIADPNFMEFRGGGGGLFVDLPPAVPGSQHGSTGFTPPLHNRIMQTDSVGPDGGCWFVLGSYDPATEKFGNLTAPVSIDWSNNVIFSMLGPDSNRGRVLHMGWIKGPNRPHRLSSMRSIQYDSRLDLLVSNPVEELTLLRGPVAAMAENLRVYPHGPPTTIDIEAQSANSTRGALDIELFIDVSDAGRYVAVNLSLIQESTSSASIASFNLIVEAADASGRRKARMSVSAISTDPEAPFFALLPGETQLPLRVLVDHGIFEVFSGFGRSVATFYLGRPLSTVTYASLELTSSAPATAGDMVVTNVTVWRMKSIGI